VIARLLRASHGDGERATMAESRKVAAILVADIVGYSRLTAADEEGTLARLRVLRSDFIDPTIAVHNGRLVKRTGDGAIVEFRSVVEAVRCAIEVAAASLSARLTCLTFEGERDRLGALQAEFVSRVATTLGVPPPKATQPEP
jgi:class 3 adenylate cyclase